jgi:DNA repair photolyase
MAIGANVGHHGPQVNYREIPCGKIIGRSRGAESGDYPFSYTVNPYRGCEIGCSYCYARNTHGYLGHDDPMAFERDIYVKLGAERRVVKDLNLGHFNGEAIAIGTATDPYQPAERRYRVTRRILEKLAAVSGLTLSITTKSPLIVDDLHLLVKLARKSDLTVNVSLISLDDSVIRHLEPKAATPQKRLETIATLAHHGIRVGMFIMPIITGVNDDPHQLNRLEAAGRRAGAAFVSRQSMSLRQTGWPVFADALKTHYPEAYTAYAGSATRLQRA